MSDAMPPADVSAMPPRRFRRLRIAGSVFFGVLTVAMCVLWVRSYWWIDSVVWGSGHFHILASYGGRLSFMGYPAAIDYGGMHLSSQRIWESFYTDRPDSTTLGFLYSVGWADRYMHIIVPNYFSALVAGCAAITPWLPYRFSLSTMLIATTLVAVMLGLVCYIVR